MYNGKTVLVMIPARGNSKRVPGKNMRSICGKPLLQYTIDQALQMETADKIIVSSEDSDILRYAAQEGITPHRRPSELSDDKKSGDDVMKYYYETVTGFDIMVSLQPTSPLRKSATIDDMVKATVDENANGAVTVERLWGMPWWCLTIKNNRAIPMYDEIIQSTDAPPTYGWVGTGFVFKWNKHALSGNIIPWIVDEVQALDIDSEMDMKFAEFVLCGEHAQGEETK